MNLDKDGLAPCPLCAARMLLERFVDWEGQPLNVQHIVHPTPTTCPLAGVQIEASTEAATAWNRRALPNTGDELVARLRADADKGSKEIGTFERVSGRHASQLVVDCIQAADAIASLTARAQAAEASLASAREALEWYADRVGGVNGWSIEGAKTRADLAEDNGRRAYAALKGVQQ